MATISILPCKSRKELRTFERIPELLLRQDPHYVPPFPGSISKIFDPKSPYQRHGALLPFIALKDGQPVGRIAAVVNDAHNAVLQGQDGLLRVLRLRRRSGSGYRCFWQRAKQELASRGLDTIRGPYNPTVNDECGLLVEGFDSSPFVMMPYNPSYYPALFERLGLKAARELYAFYFDAANLVPERIEKIVNRVKRSTGLVLRNIQLSRLSEELKIIQALYNETLDRNWGFVPVTLEDLEYAANDLKAIIDPEMVMIAEKGGVPVGFSMTIPNINEFMYKAKNSGVLMRMLKFVWYLKTSTPKQARLAILGVRPEYRNSGIAAMFYFESLMRGKKKYTGGELSWVEETNKEMVHAITVMGGRKYKTYRIYEASLAN